MSAERLERSFFERSVHEVARDLIGCRLLFEGRGGTIVETESYERNDPACHAYVGLTERTRTLFGPPGHAYVYLSYGIHSLLNAVCEPEGEAAAVLPPKLVIPSRENAPRTAGGPIFRRTFKARFAKPFPRLLACARGLI